MSDPFENSVPSALSYGTRSVDISPADADILPNNPKCVEVTSIAAGTRLDILPVDNADDDYVTYDPVFVGFSPRFRVRRVGPSTTCTVVGVDG